MLVKTVVLLLAALVAVPCDAELDPKKKEDEFCIPLQNIGKDCKVVQNTVEINTQVEGYPGADANTDMKIIIDGKLGDMDVCYTVTYVTNTTTSLTVQLPDGISCLDLQFRSGQWCTGTCPTSRRLQDSAFLLDEQDTLYQDYSTMCADYEYDVALYVDTHMMAVASPKQDAIAAGCPLFVSHSTYDRAKDKHEKELLAWVDDKKREEAEARLYADAYPIGTFKLSDLAKAHKNIEMSKVTQGKTYDIVSNNCAAFMMALAKSLNVKIDSKMTAFVARRLLQSSSNEFVNRIRTSVNFKSLFSGRQLRTAETASSDKEIIELLVEKNSAGLV